MAVGRYRDCDRWLDGHFRHVDHQVIPAERFTVVDGAGAAVASRRVLGLKAADAKQHGASILKRKLAPPGPPSQR